MTAQFATLSIHAGSHKDPVTGAILTPIYQTATYVQEGIGVHKGYTYSRSHNPTVTALEEKLGELDQALPAICFATGMAATSALLIGLLKSGDHIICGDVVYGGTVRLINQVLDKFDLACSYVDTSKPETIEAAITPNTRLIFIETPANPTLKLTDIAAVAQIAKKHQLLLVVDNTFLTSALQKCFDLGADVVLYSTTKYIDGHNATVGGALVTRDKELREKFYFTRNALGSIQSPFDAWLILQGVKTLELRLKQHSKNAQAVAEYLENHPEIAKVTYPGLKSFSQHELAQRQQLDFGGMVTFEVKGGYERAVKFMNSVRLCSLAESLGSIETLITYPVLMTHGPVPEAQRKAVGITDGLIRLSVGLEHVQDIIKDIEQALGASK